MRTTALIILTSTLASTSVAMNVKPHITLLSRTIKGDLVMLKGIIARNETGELTCLITHNIVNDMYSGVVYNGNYSEDEWSSQPLLAGEAKGYYKRLLGAKYKVENTI